MNNNKRRVLFVNNVVYLPGEGGYKRTLYLFDMMRNMGYPVTLITSNFNHYKKQVRDLDKFKKEYPDCGDIRFIKVPPYTTNISLKRYYSEWVWTFKFKNWLKKHIDKYDVVYMNMPDYDQINAVKGICEKHGKKIILDVRDLRPEAFHVMIKNDRLFKIFFYWMRVSADRAYACADELVAVSKEYLDIALRVNKKSKNPAVVYIGAILDKFYDGIKKYAHTIEKPNGEVWATYAGTLGESYDLDTVIAAAKKCADTDISNLRLKIIGQGPSAEHLKKYADKIGANNVDFIGFVDYEMMAAYLSKSDMTINAIKKNASQSIINKVADYFAAGVPMLNSCCCQEQLDMVTEYKIGLNYEPGNIEQLASYMALLAKDKSICKLYGDNARKLAEEKFDRRNSYLELINRIDTV